MTLSLKHKLADADYTKISNTAILNECQPKTTFKHTHVYNIVIIELQENSSTKEAAKELARILENRCVVCLNAVSGLQEDILDGQSKHDCYYCYTHKGM